MRVGALFVASILTLGLLVYLKNAGMLLMIGAMLFALSLAAIQLFISKSIVSPLKRLAEAVARMGGGDLSARMDESKAKDEMLFLYRSFNSYAATQQGWVEKLEHEIEVRRAAEAALAYSKSEELFRIRFENMHEGCQIIDRDYRYHYVNNAAAEQGRMAKDGLIGRSMSDVFPGFEHTEAFAAIRNCMENRIGVHFDNYFSYPDGGATWFELSVQPAPEGVLILSADISERKRADSEYLARMAAELANRTKSDFLSNMSHELRTPLNSIIGFTEVLLDSLYGSVNEKQHEYLGFINSSGRHLLTLINEILDLSKIQSGKRDAVLSSFELRATLELSLTMLREKAKQRGISLEGFLDPIAGIVLESDEQMIKQIVFNLLSNAVKFTPEGGSVRMEARTDGAEDGVIAISVSDTGIGIRKEDFGRLFTEFSQIDSPLQKRFEGTGLGLAISKRLVELLGGRIEMQSTEGAGSVFSIFLPRAAGSAVAGAAAKARQGE